MICRASLVPAAHASQIEANADNVKRIEFQMAIAVSRATTIPAATLAVAIVLGALCSPPAARAGEYCRLDTDHMTGCGFSSTEQCEATRSGLGGDCFRDPFLKGNTATINRSAYAYSPRPSHRERRGRASAANTNN
jgi:Protein of unknown function (DUF3551)